LEAAGYAPTAFDLSPAFGQTEMGNVERRTLAPGSGSLIVHHNGPYLPHALPSIAATPNMRGKLGLPSDALVVLNVFHLGSAFSRKNPLAAVAAFRKAFGDASDRVLAIKLIDNGAGGARRELDAAIAGAGNIRLIEGMLPEADMAGLMAAADIVISLHRSEGFGLVPAQAMARGKPVIATSWSGNLDF